MRALCEEVDGGGGICPGGSSVFVADLAYSSDRHRFAAVDVPFKGDGIFWMDAGDLGLSGYSSYAGVSQRGCAFDGSTGTLYTSGWNDQTLWRLDQDFGVLGAWFLGENVAGLAVDEGARRLYASTNDAVDEIVEFALEEDGSATPTGGRWAIPWILGADGFAAAALEYDDASGTFVLVNQDAGSVEYFELREDELVPVSACEPPGESPWGIGLDFSAVELALVDAGAHACDFQLRRVEPDSSIVGGAEPSGWVVADLRIASAVVGSAGGPLGLEVRNHGGEPVERALWLTLDAAPELVLPLSSALFPAGASVLYTGVLPVDAPVLPPGSYTGWIHLGEDQGAPPDASAHLLVELVAPGLD
jgi:hypothetical protein